MAAGSVVGSCWERLEDTSPSSSNSPNGSLGTTTKGPSAPGRRQDQDPEAPRAGPMTPQSQAVSSAWRYPRALLSQWLFEEPRELGSHTQLCQAVPSLAFQSFLSLLLLPFSPSCSSKQPVSTAPCAEPHHSSSISCQHRCLAALTKQQLPAS